MIFSHHLVGVGAHDDPTFTTPRQPGVPASKNFSQTNRTAANDVRTEFRGYLLKLKLFSIQFF